LKTFVAALAGASLLGLAVPAAAQHHGGGGGSRGGPSSEAAHSGWSRSDSARGGGWSHGGAGWSRGSGGWSRGSTARPGWGGRFAGGHGYYPRHYYRGYPYAFAGFGLGLAFGLAADPWYYGGPYYGGPYYGGSYYSYDGPPPPAYYEDIPPPAVGAPPPEAAQPPAACGSWSWDAANQKYDWIPC